MREFNTSGPCDPRLHYTVMREDLLRVGQKMVEKGKYFTIRAPRQTGKTTYFKLLIDRLNRCQDFKAFWISFEAYRDIPREKFLYYFKRSILNEMNDSEIKNRLEKIELNSFLDFYNFFTIDNFEKQLTLVIDEIEGCPESVISALMHTLREMYHKKQLHALQSLILVGVSNISGIIMDYASPFNIADELIIPYFTEGEVKDLISQYEAESSQEFEDKVKQKIYQDTAGQPGLVCGICKDLVEKFCLDKGKPITMDDYWRCLDYYLREKIDKNISNVVAKAKQEKDLMLKILFSEEEMPYTVHDERMKYLLVNGVINR